MSASYSNDLASRSPSSWYPFSGTLPTWSTTSTGTSGGSNNSSSGSSSQSSNAPPNYSELLNPAYVNGVPTVNPAQGQIPQIDVNSILAAATGVNGQQPTGGSFAGSNGGMSMPNGQPNYHNMLATPSGLSMGAAGGSGAGVSGAMGGTPSQPTGSSLSQIATNAVTQALMPQFQQQQGALTAQLANAGIVGGPSGAASSALSGQQQQTLQAAIQPLIQQYASLGLQGALANQGAALQGSQFNAQQQNALNEYNASNLINTSLANAGSYNNMAQYLAGLQNNDWLAQLQAQTGLQEATAGGTAQAFQPIYTNPSPTNLSGLGSFASQPNTSATPSTPPSTSAAYYDGFS